MDTTRIPRIALVSVLCLLMVGSASVAVAQSSSLFSDDFEDGNADGWDTGGTVTQTGYNGQYSLELSLNDVAKWTDAGSYNSDALYFETTINVGDNIQTNALSIGFSDGTYDGNDNDHVRIVRDTNNGMWEFEETQNGGNTIQDMDIAPTHTGWIKMKFQLVDGEYRFKNWPAGQSEPESWQYTSQSQATLDGMQFTTRSNSGDSTSDPTYVDNITVSESPPPDGAVSGRVTTTGEEPIPNATIETNTSVSTTTDVGGFYNLPLQNGTYNLTASKDGYRNVTEQITVEGEPVEQDFQLTQFNQSINLDTKRFIEHGQSADYRVIVTNDTGRHNVTGDANVTSGNESVVAVDTDALQLEATTDISVNQRTPVTAEWEDSEGNEYVTQTNVTVANATVDNIDILPTWTKTSASLGDETLQLIIVATIMGAGAAIFASSFAGLTAATGITVLGWFAGMASDGVLIVAFMMAIFIGLNLAGNINMQVARG